MLKRIDEYDKLKTIGAERGVFLQSILDVFEKTVEKFGEKNAVADRSGSYSFAELKKLAEKTGAFIANLGYSNCPIGVFADRRISTVVMFLGVLYSGNFYVPLDKDMPKSKIDTIFVESGMKLVLGEDISYRDDENISFVDFFDIEKSDFALKNIDRKKDSPMYMVYTSGSTGKPKGVLKSHGAVIDFINAYTLTFDFNEEDVIGNQSPFFFDASAKDFALMLKTGAELQILPTELFLFPVNLIRYMNERKVTFISWVPSALSVVSKLNTFAEIRPDFLKKVFFVGETFPVKQLRKWMENVPYAKYVNLYGSSEIAGICSYYEIESADDICDPLPIGKPLPGCEMFLLSDGKFITAPDTTGEIYIASTSLASEYYGDPEKTSASFFIMTLPSGRQQRVFKTGDIAKFNNNGDLVFVSRSDTQIKHMGHRIELGEIETAAESIPGIHKSCCLYDDEKMKIVLFCEPTDHTDTSPSEIRKKLKTKLSDYMVPGKVIVAKLPVNANGKTDRILLKTIMQRRIK